MAKNRALGKGLSALISGASGGESSRRHGDAAFLPLERIVPNPAQPRKEMNPAALESLTASVRIHGIVQPLVVRERGDGFFELVAGERRWRAAGAAGLNEVPVRVMRGTDREMREIALVENIQREDLSPLDAASALQELLKAFSLTQEEVAERIGWSRTALTNKLRLLQLPGEVKELLSSGQLSEGHGRALLSLDSPEAMVSLAASAIKKGFSVRQLEETVRTWKNGKSAKSGEAAKNLEIPAAIRKLAENLGLSLRMTGRNSRMRLSIDGMTAGQAEAVLSCLEASWKGLLGEI